MELRLEGTFVNELGPVVEEAAEEVEKWSEYFTWVAIASKLAGMTAIKHPHLYLQIAYMSDGTWKKGPGRPDITILNH